MKKMTVVFLSVLMVFGLAACGRDSGSRGTDETTPGVQTPAADAEDSESTAPNDVMDESLEPDGGEDAANLDSEPDTLESGKVLVVYYSATGYTEAVANVIAETAGADIFELIPTEIYTDEDLNWRNSDSRVSIENDDPSKRNVPLEQETIENWEEYNTVFIGYPIWWGIAAWPVDTFIEANDFTGKTVIPFCTSTSSGLGESGELLSELAGTGEWLEGQRFRERPDAEDVKAWILGLGL